MEIIIGNKAWSTWSLRPWLALKRAGAPFKETLIRLRGLSTHDDIVAAGSPSGLVPALKDGALRNAYTVKVANKTQRSSDFVLSISGLEAGGLLIAESSAAPSSSISLPVHADSLATFRVFAVGQPTRLRDGSQEVALSLRNADSGEQTRAASIFLGPGAPVR